MTKQILRLVMVAMCLYASTAKAQLANPPIFIETIVHNGDYGEANHDLTGYVTYKVYVQFANSNCYLTNIFAIGNPFDCVQDAQNSVSFDFDCGLFQHELGSAFGFDQLCFLVDDFPTSQFDSYLTIGQTCNDNAGCDNIASIGECEEWIENFEQTATFNNYFDGGSFFWDEYSLYGASCFQQYPESPTNADENSRVFIGQFTTCGDMNGCINIQYRDGNGVPGIEETEICFSASNPCLDNPMEADDITIANPCFENGLATVELNSSGGNGDITYTIFTTNDEEITSYTGANGIVEIADIPEGDFYILLEDEAGCQIVTPGFNVTFPEPFLFQAFVLTDELCFGALGGSIELQCSGGTGIISIEGDDNIDYGCGDILDGITCGSYEFTAIDESDCEVVSTAAISCPAPLEFTPTTIDIDCYGDDDGVIFGTITGGTGDITASWELNDVQLGADTSSAPFALSIDSLDQGTYTISIIDSNNCSISALATIIEPEPITYTFTVEDASCFGFNDGALNVIPSGGTPPIDTLVFNENGINIPDSTLLAGWYQFTLEDNLGCAVSDSFYVDQPTDITFTIDTTDVTCFDLCNGAIQLTNVEGSAGGYTYAIEPDEATCGAPCSGSQVSFTDLCTGDYTITITSTGDGCTTVAEAFVATPDPIEISFTTQNVSCKDEDDGVLIITEITGGTAPFDSTVYTSADPTTPYEEGFNQLIATSYIIVITDSLNCEGSSPFTITEPDSLILTIDTTLACSCGDICDGIIRYTPQGGTLNYQYLLTPGNIFGPAFNVVSGLCADEYKLILIDANGCRDSAMVEVLAPEALEIDIFLNAPTCTGMTDGEITFELSGGNGDLNLMVDPDTYELIEEDSVTFRLENVGEDTLYLEMFDENSCRILDTLGIVPDEITDMILSMSSTPETCWNERNGTATVAVQNGNPPYEFLWDDNENQTTATAMGLAPNSDYMVLVTDAIGCNLSSSVFVDGNKECFFISTGITPNGDGVNDTWVLGGFEYYPECKVNVFNRWGQNIFTSTGYSAPWDGRFNGQLLPVADYYFTIDYSEEKEVIMGTVTLKY